MKAIVITPENQDMLCIRYDLDAGAFPIGYIMVTEFGDEGDFRYIGVLHETTFNEKYVKGEAIQNGFFAVTKKEEA
jgi:hypothetical protein